MKIFSVISNWFKNEFSSKPSKKTDGFDFEINKRHRKNSFHKNKFKPRKVEEVGS